MDSPRWEKTTTDILGRTMRVEKPGFDNLETEENFFNTKGQLIKTSVSGQADTISEYDDLGARIRTGLDINHNGILDVDSNDRINENESRFILIDKVCWEERTQRVYAGELDANATITGIQRTRITNRGSDGNTEESVFIDIHGNQTVTKVFIDRDNKTETRITRYPDSVTGEVSVNVNGLLMSSQSKTGVNITYSYDALGRRTGITHPRTGTTTTHYNDKGQVDYGEDPAGNRTRYEYDPNTGQKISEINALNKVTRYAYNDRDQLTHTWGDTVYPVKYVYDTYGQMIKMHTYRNDPNWTLETWPADAGEGDVTTWHYQESTGLLTAKEDAAGKSVTYTYTFGGKPATRTWARTSGDNPLVTTYSYSPHTGELLGIDYSDSTPDITFTYNRLGRKKTVTDAAGTRTFIYNNTLQLEYEIITGLYDKVITRTYETKEEVDGESNGEINGETDSETNSETEGLTNSENNSETKGDTNVETMDEINIVPGRISGFTLGTDSALSTDHAPLTDHAPETNYTRGTDPALETKYTGGTDPALETEYKVTYRYDDMGRHSSIGWDIGETPGTTIYSYVPESDLLYQLTTGNQQQTTYSYEPHRDLRTRVKNEFNTRLISQYDYEYDPLARRSSVKNSGRAFSTVANAFNLYQYNDRSELTESARYLGADISDTNNPVESEYRAYKYDPIGNRRESTIAKETGTYTTNVLNQYTRRSLPGNGIKSFTYDDDGNLTSIINDSVENPSEDIKYTYNAENRLIAVEPQNPVDGDKKLEFVYDYMGRRVKKKIYILNSGNWTVDSEILFIYDGWNMISEITTENEKQTTRYYVWGLDLSQSIQGAGGIGGLLACIEPSSSASYYYIYDVNGNVGQLVDAQTGDISAHYEYDDYGIEAFTYETLTINNPFRFSTKYYDREYNLYYYGYRYYSPWTGRWLTRDPIEEKGFNYICDIKINEILRFSPYLFVSNQTTNKWDLLGLLFGIWAIDEELKNRAYSLPAIGTEMALSVALGFAYVSGKSIMFFPSTCELASYVFRTYLNVFTDPRGYPSNIGFDVSLGLSTVFAWPGERQTDRSALSWTGNVYTATAGNDKFNIGVSYTDPPSWRVRGIGASFGPIDKIPISMKYIVTHYDFTPTFELILLPRELELTITGSKIIQFFRLFSPKNPINLEKNLPCICNALRRKMTGQIFLEIIFK